MDLLALVDHHLTNEERAEHLLFRGEMHLLCGDFAKGEELFAEAAKLDPTNPKLFYREGLSLFEYGSEDGKERVLLLATKKFKQAIDLNPHLFEAHLAWGNALTLLGKRGGEARYFTEAEQRLRQAIPLAAREDKEAQANFWWDYGLIWSEIADHSEEAVDLNFALEAFQKAATFSELLPNDFLLDHGKVCLKFAQRLMNVRYCVKAINYLRQALSKSDSFYEAWLELAKAFQLLHSQTHDEDHFAQADECYSAAAQLLPHDVDLWLNWASFLCEAGKQRREIKHLQSCVEKCQRGFACDAEEIDLIAVWAEALALLGEMTEKIELLNEAQNKIVDTVDIASDAPNVWFSYGMVLNCLGHYFEDVDYFYQAIEKFQCGLSIDRTCHKHWHAIGIAYLTAGQADDDDEVVEKSLRFFTKALSISSSSYYIFDYALALLKLGEMSHDQQRLEEAVQQCERALSMQKNAIYIHPEWLFAYACALDMLGDFREDDSTYLRAIEIFSHVLMMDPEFPLVHHRLALAFSHLGDLNEEIEHFYRAIHHYRLAYKHDDENDLIFLDWSLALINTAQLTSDAAEIEALYKEAEHKLIQSAKLGNSQAFYQLGCLYSILGQYDRAMHFVQKADFFHSLPPLEEILDDDWLDGLRSTPDFREYLAQLERRSNLQEER